MHCYWCCTLVMCYCHCCCCCCCCWLLLLLLLLLLSKLPGARYTRTCHTICFVRSARDVKHAGAPTCTRYYAAARRAQQDKLASYFVKKILHSHEPAPGEPALCFNALLRSITSRLAHVVHASTSCAGFPRLINDVLLLQQVFQSHQRKELG
jgi:hypothetical protein